MYIGKGIWRARWWQRLGAREVPSPMAQACDSIPMGEKTSGGARGRTAFGGGKDLRVCDLVSALAARCPCVWYLPELLANVSVREHATLF